jgi:hypothetical protein
MQQNLSDRNAFLKGHDFAYMIVNVEKGPGRCKEALYRFIICDSTDI